jgi:hypothetical protein
MDVVGRQYGYFNSEEDAEAFYDELRYTLITQTTRQTLRMVQYRYTGHMESMVLRKGTILSIQPRAN